MAKKGFVYYIFTWVAIAIQFLLYMVNSAQSGYMDGLGWIFYLTASVSHAAIISFIPYLVFCLTLLIVRNEKIAGFIHVLLSSLLCVFFYINGTVFALYRQHINGMMLSLFFGEGSSEIFQIDASLYLKTSVILAVLIAAMIFLKWLSVKLFEIKKKGYVLPAVIVFIITLLTSNGIHAYAAVAQRASVIKSAAYVPYYFPLTATRFMIKMGVVDQSDLLEVDFGKQTDLQYPHNPIVNETDSFPNIVIIAIDSWNYRSLNEEVMPNVSSFARNNELFTNHLSSSNGTRGSIFGIFYGVSSYYWRDFDISGTTPVLIDELQKAGYSIKPLASATLNNPNFNKLLFRKVPDVQTETEGERVYDRDCRITEQFSEFLDTLSEGRPFFGFLFYDLAHSFVYPKELKKKFTPSWEFAEYTKLNNNMDPTPFWNLYLNCVNAVDSLVGMVLDDLEKRDLLNSTYIILTGDHGQEFNENHKNYWGHGSNYTYPQIHVPLILHRPDGRNGVYSHRTTHYDISATLLHDAMGVSNPVEDYTIGYLLEDTVFRNWHVVGDNLNYAFIIEDNTIVEKKPSGMLEICDSVLEPLEGYKLNVKELNDAVTRLNTFYK